MKEQAVNPNSAVSGGDLLNLIKLYCNRTGLGNLQWGQATLS